jgi:gamma-glutamyltranspeptidase/glutathione hydrolase
MAMILGFVACIGQSAEPVAQPSVAPEGASGLAAKSGWKTSRFSIAAANPIATAAGFEVLKAGGSAVDAAIAVQMVLGLVEPQSSGIGGGAFLLHFDGTKVQAFDGREVAPAAVDERLFMQEDGRPMNFTQAALGGRAVGVPGVLAMLELAHRQHGVLPWSRLFQPAIDLAEQGFPISPRLHALLVQDQHLQKDPSAAAYFYDVSGQPWPVGTVLKNPALARLLRQVAAEGSRAFYEGPVASALVNKVRSHPTNPGLITLADMANYRAREREPLCHPQSFASGQVVRLCGFPPPSSGALAIGQILGMLQATPAAARPLAPDGVPDALWLHNYTEAARLAFADRALYVGDPDFLPQAQDMWRSLLAPDYLMQRAGLIGQSAMKEAPAGRPSRIDTAWAPMLSQPEYGTSHISIVDAQGRAVAMTTTIEAAFGTRQMIEGFLLNNQLTDFSFIPDDTEGRLVANRVQPGKRPRSSMSPTLVFNAADGKLLMSAGSPGGSLIIHYTAKTLWGVLQWRLDTQQAINLPNFGNTGGPVFLEEGRFPLATLAALRALGHSLQEMPMTSGLQAIQRLHDGYFGGADPRREGTVMGD